MLVAGPYACLSFAASFLIVRAVLRFHGIFASSHMTARAARGALSHVALGTAYERQCQSFARTYLRMSLIQVGGANDEGIDLRGTWSLPSCDRQFNIIAQCKRYKRKVPPNHIRELVGTVAHYRQQQQSRENDTLAVLFASGSWSTQSILKANESSTPILLVHLEPTEDSTADAEGRYALNGKIDLLCKGAVANHAWTKALDGSFAIKRPILHKRPGAPVGTQFLYNNTLLYDMSLEDT